MQQRGRPIEALKLIGQALAVNARVPAAYANFGLVLAVLERHEEAVAAYERAIALKPDYAESFNGRGNALRALERRDEALDSYAQALALKPEFPEALNNRGNALLELGRPEDALQSYAQALACRPGYADALVNRGKCLIALKRGDEALASFDRALALAPAHAAALKERGHLLRDRWQPAEALASYDLSLAANAQDAEAHAGRALALRDLKRFNEAVAACDRALALKPDYADAVIARGNVFFAMRDFSAALSEYDRAIAMRPDFAQAHGNRANALMELNRIAEALADYDRALALTPYASAFVNRGVALRYLNRPGEALDSLERALALDPDMPEAHWNKALACLSLGDFARGWEGFEWRWRGGTELKPRDFAQPQWRGEDLAGKTILLHAEQGFGDTIQMLRYLPMVKAKARKILLEIPQNLRPLVGEPGDGITMIGRNDVPPPFDLHCPLMSLPLAFRTTLATVPNAVPYLRAPADRIAKWRALLPRNGRRRVGLVWAGRPDHKNDHNRSLTLSMIAPLLAVPGIDFVSLQREYRDADLAALGGFPVTRIDRALADFADTAAAVEQCDLVIAVDTAVAHLAGALGKPVWILLAQVQDWRWLLDREDSPWYPSARLFRQPAIGDWDSVIERVKTALAGFAT